MWWCKYTAAMCALLYCHRCFASNLRVVKFVVYVVHLLYEGIKQSTFENDLARGKCFLFFIFSFLIFQNDQAHGDVSFFLLLKNDFARAGVLFFMFFLFENDLARGEVFGIKDAQLFDDDLEFSKSQRPSIFRIQRH